MPQIKQTQILKENLNHITKAQPIITLSFNSYIILNGLNSHLLRSNLLLCHTDIFLFASLQQAKGNR